MIYVMLIGLGIMSYNITIELPKEIVKSEIEKSEARITQLLYIKEAAGTYYRTNPSTTGLILPGSYSPHLVTGAIITGNVIVLVSGGQMYTYSSTAPNPRDIDALARKTNCSELSGRTLSGGTFRPSCIITGGGTSVIPASIPANRLITVGR